MDPGSSVRFALTPVAIGSLLLTAGCQSVVRSVGLDTGAKGASHDEVRTLLATGEYEVALERIGPEGDAAPTDIALWLLYQGTVAYHAGRYAESAEALDLAHYVSEARYTRRLGTGLLSLITNDRILPYVPDRTERLLIHYYAALDYLRLDQPLEAAVEARRLSFMLARYAADPPLRDHPDLAAHMRLVAGLIFRAAGERNDADVAFRLAYAAAAAPGGGVLAPAVAVWTASGLNATPDTELDALLPARALMRAGDARPDSTGEVVVLIERGFIAPRIQEDVELALWEHELDVIGSANVVQRAAAATCIAEYVLRNADPLSLPGRIDVDEAETERCVAVPEDWDERKAAVAERTKSGADEFDGEDDYTGPDTDVRDGRPLPAPRVGRPPMVTNGGALEPPAPKSVEDLVRGPADPAVGSAASPAGDPLSRSHRARRAEAHGASPNGPARAFVRLALPTYRLRAESAASVVQAASENNARGGIDVSLPVDLSACVMEEFAADASFVLAKSIARSAARYSIARGLESGARGRGQVLGEVIGLLADAAAEALERADTRSWRLLPASLGVVRLQLPIGEHPLTIQTGSGDAVPGCDLGTVRVEADRTPILSCRAWH
jgi:tetratricopeptide (TPR) repeat protein